SLEIFPLQPRTLHLSTIQIAVGTSPTPNKSLKRIHCLQPAIHLTMSSITDLLPQIRGILTNKGTNGLRVISVQAPPACGKSTQLVPEIWKLVQGETPGTQGIYILQRAVLASQLHDHFRETKAVDTSSEWNHKPKAHEDDGKLSVCSYFYIRRWSPLQWSQQHHRLAIFIDVEMIPTATGDALFGLLVERVRGLRDARQSQPNFELTLVLLGSYIRPAVHITLQEFLSVKIEMLEWHTENTVALSPFDGDGARMAWVKNALVQSLSDHDSEEGEVAQGPPGHCVILYMPLDDARTHIAGPLLKVDKSIHVYFISPDSNREELLLAMADAHRKLVCVDPTIAFTLPFQNVQLAISSCTKVARVFDSTTSQFPLARMSISKTELRRQSSCLLHSKQDKGGPAQFVMLRDAARDSEMPNTPSPTTQVDVTRLLLEVYNIWPGLVDFDVPIPAFVEMDQARVLEVRRRLRVTQSLQPSFPARAFQLTELGNLMVQVLDDRTERRGSTHSAHMSARTMSDSGLSDSCVGVLIRLAAIAKFGARNLFSLTEQGRQACRDGKYADLLLKIKTDCAGVGAQQHANGSLWVALGLWQRLRIDKRLSDDTLADVTEVAEGHIGIDRKTALQILQSVEQVEYGFRRQWADETLTLTEAERLKVNEVLVWSHLHQMIYFPNPALPTGANGPVDMASLRAVDINRAHFIPIDLSWRYADLKGPPEIPGLFGFYQDMMLADTREGSQSDKPIVSDITLIPTQAFREIEKRTRKNLFKIVATTYPV
ncbi:hypothetical protein BJ170DRAFT_714473, partial [Xylariales sp. AK1849]